MLKTAALLLCAWLPCAPRAQLAVDELIGRMESALGSPELLAEIGDLELIGTLETTEGLYERRLLIRRAPFAYREEMTWRGPPGAPAADDSAAPPSGIVRHQVYVSDGVWAWKLAGESGPGGLLAGLAAVSLLDNALFFRLLTDPRATLQALDRPPQLVPPRAARSKGVPATSEVLFIAGRQSTVWNVEIERESGRIASATDGTGATTRGFVPSEWRTAGRLTLPTHISETVPTGVVIETRFEGITCGLRLDDALFAGGPRRELDEPLDAGPLRVVLQAVPGSAQYVLTGAKLAGGGHGYGELWAMFDTGASAIYIASAMADLLQPPLIATEGTIGAGGRGQSSVRWMDRLELGRLNLLQFPATAVEFPPSTELPLEHPVAVVLGGPRLMECSPVLDLEAGRLWVRGPAGPAGVRPLAEIAGRPALTVPLTTNEYGCPTVEISIGGRSLTVLLDTGIGHMARLTRSDLVRLGLPDDGASWEARGAVPLGMVGVLGQSDEWLVRLDDDLVMGPVRYQRPWILIAPPEGETKERGAFAHSLIGGAALLPFAQVGFDWPARRLELVPRQVPEPSEDRYVVPAPGPLPGLLLEPPRPGALEPPLDRPLVARVDDGSAAARAGLQAGDRLTALDGVSCLGVAPMDVWSKLWGAFAERPAVTLEVWREGSDVRVELAWP